MSRQLLTHCGAPSNPRISHAPRSSLDTRRPAHKALGTALRRSLAFKDVPPLPDRPGHRDRKRKIFQPEVSSVRQYHKQQLSNKEPSYSLTRPEKPWSSATSNEGKSGALEVSYFMIRPGLTGPTLFMNPLIASITPRSSHSLLSSSILCSNSIITKVTSPESSYMGEARRINQCEPRDGGRRRLGVASSSPTVP